MASYRKSLILRRGGENLRGQQNHGDEIEGKRQWFVGDLANRSLNIATPILHEGPRSGSARDT
jgi:hypothetical protein